MASDSAQDSKGAHLWLFEWSEEVYCAESLAGKLKARPRRASSALGARHERKDASRFPELGRPSGMALPAPERREHRDIPSRHELDDPLARGRLLHAFANHELLALELLAQAILKFREAPLRMLLGLAATLEDEQRHLSLYVERMAALGVPFGSRPLSRAFFDAIAEAADPASFHARMGLTLEQANLDHALSYGRAFRAVGDLESAAIMDRVFTDEVRHVRQGARWLARWVEPGADLWEAWTVRLGLQLKPADARGPEFDAGARAEAGLPEDWIARLAATPRTKHRPPVVWWGNFDVEEELRTGATKPKDHGPTFATAADLEPLLAWLAAPGDLLLLREEIPTAFWAELVSFGLPEIETRLHSASLRDWPRDRKVAGARSFGASPAADAVLAPWRRRSDGRPCVGPGPAEAALLLSSKATAARALPAVLEALGDSGLSAETLLDPAEAPEVIEAEAALSERTQSLAGTDRTFVWKRVFSQSGRERRWTQGAMPPAISEFCRRALREDRALLCEPWHQRLADFSLHFEARPGGRLRRVGCTRFVTDAKGRFLATMLHPTLGGLDQQTRALLYRFVIGPDCALPAALQSVLEPLIQRTGFVGPLSIDAMIIAGKDGAQPRLHPLLEINPRFSLGRIALELLRRIQGGVPAAFCLLPEAAWDSPAAKIDLLAIHPPRRNARGLLQSGLLPLAPPTRARVRLPLLAVGREALQSLATRKGFESLSSIADPAER